MLLKVGYAMAALAVVLAGVVVALVSMDEPAPSAAVKSAQEPAPEPLKRTDPMVEPWREKALATPSPEEPDSEPAAEPAPRPEPREPEPAPEPQPAPEPEPVVYEEPPEPTEEQIASAYRPRRYELPDGAVLGLTIKALGVRDAPVFDSVGAWALKYGVGHHPESSMPWTQAPQRNVYLAAHRLGFPGTASHLVFYRLNELGAGDEIILKNRDGDKYTYRVTETFKANPGDSWVMGQVPDRDMVTLQTCTGPNWERRLIVRADRL